jgi:hypothetical protein
MCFQQHVTVFNAILCSSLHLTWGGHSCQRSISELIFCVISLLERDAHIYAYQWHLMYLHALSLSSVLYCHYVYERGRSSETMIPGPILPLRKFLVTFMLFYFQFLKSKITKTMVTHIALFWFCKLSSCWCLTTTTVNWDAKLFVCCCRLLEAWRKWTTSVFPESLI